MKLLVLLLMATVVVGSESRMTYNQKKEAYRLQDAMRRTSGTQEKKREQAPSSDSLENMGNDVNQQIEHLIEEVLEKFNTIDSGLKGLMLAPLMGKIGDTLGSLGSICDNVLNVIHSQPLEKKTLTTPDPHEGMTHPDERSTHPPKEYSLGPEYTPRAHRPSKPTARVYTLPPWADTVRRDRTDKRASMKVLLRALDKQKQQPPTTADPHEGMTHPDERRTHPPSEYTPGPQHTPPAHRHSTATTVVYTLPPWLAQDKSKTVTQADTQGEGEAAAQSGHKDQTNDKRALLKALIRVLSEQITNTESKRRTRRSALLDEDWQLIGNVCKAYQVSGSSKSASDEV